MGQNSSTRSIIAAASVAPPMCTGPSASATCAGSRTSRAYGSTDSSVVETTIFGRRLRARSLPVAHRLVQRTAIDVEHGCPLHPDPVGEHVLRRLREVDAAFGVDDVAVGRDVHAIDDHSAAPESALKYRRPYFTSPNCISSDPRRSAIRTARERAEAAPDSAATAPRWPPLDQP